MTFLLVAIIVAGFCLFLVGCALSSQVRVQPPLHRRPNVVRIPKDDAA